MSEKPDSLWIDESMIAWTRYREVDAEYIRADAVQKMLAEQQEACATRIKSIDEAEGTGIHGVIFKDEAIVACINATGESDD